MGWLRSKSLLWFRLGLGSTCVFICGTLVSALLGATAGGSTHLILALLTVIAMGGLATFGVTFLAARDLASSIRQLVTATDAVADGKLDHRADVVTRDEVGQLAASFNAMAAALQVRARGIEQEERRHTEELVQLQSRMVHSEKLASMGRLAAGVAHELNTPLGGVLSLAMLVLEECGESHPFRKDLEIIVKQTLRCRDIVKGLLDFAHQSGRQLSHREYPGAARAASHLSEYSDSPQAEKRLTASFHRPQPVAIGCHEHCNECRGRDGGKGGAHRRNQR